MKIPETSPEELQTTMEKFDSELRSTPRWERWQEDETYKYAIERNGQLYPVKQIVSMATGVPVKEFSGGNEANSYVEKYGLTIIEIPVAVRGIKTNLQAVLSKYKDAVGTEPFGKASSVWPIFGALERSLKTPEAVKKHADLNVTWSAGLGNWARIPWVAIFDRRETKTIQAGAYCVFLFRQDMSGVYLTFNQGVEQLNKEHGRIEAREITHRTAQELRKQLSGLLDKGFLLDDNIDLKTDADLGKDYQSSTIAYKFYETNSVPDDDQIHEDLDAILTAYEDYLLSKGITAMRNWIFQASPQFYDLQGALKGLKEQTWLTSQYKTEIHTGDRVFLWEAGTDAGILGVATVLSEPAEIAHPDSEKPFMKDQSKFSGLQPRVHLRIDRVLESRLRRVDLQKDPVLSKLRIILNPRGTNYPVSTEEAQKLETLLGMPTSTEPTAVPAANTDRYGELVERTFLPHEFFKDLETLLLTKQQVILQGAPGTGKTFVAKELANWWAGATDRVKIVQFHESYGYEDFVEGFKPKDNPNGLGPQFVPTPGPFKEVCEMARSVPDQKPVVLIIDEINRAKTSRVFGELLYLLEYRQEQITLQTGKSFSIPTNLFVVGTMNTVDKSIALVDYALRRRFAFVTLNPVVDGKSVVLRKWLEQKNIENADELEKLFVALNQLVSAKDESLMIGHSYFMTKEIENNKKVTDDDLKFIWTYYILPLVREYEYELTTKEVEEKYGFEAIKKMTK